MSLVWMFQAHRDQFAELQAARAQAEVFAGKVVSLTEDNSRLTTALREAGEIIAKLQQSTVNVGLFEHYQKQVLQEAPFDDGKIPAHAWLTPGDDEPERENA